MGDLLDAQPPLDWSHPGVIELRRILSAAYPSVPDAKVVLGKARVDVADLPTAPASMVQIWQAAMDDSCRRGTLRTLVDAVLADTSKEAFHDLLRKLPSRPTSPSTHPAVGAAPSNEGKTRPPETDRRSAGVKRRLMVVLVIAVPLLSAAIVLRLVPPDPTPPPPERFIDFAIVASEPPSSSPGMSSPRTLIEGLELTFVPANFQVRRIRAGRTDRDGRAVIRVTPDPDVPRRNLEGRLRIDDAPSRLQDKMPLLTAKWGTWEGRDGITRSLPGTLDISKHPRVEEEVDVISADDAPLHFARRLAALVDEMGARVGIHDPADSGLDLDATIKSRVQELNLDAELTSEAIAQVVRSIAEDRPALPVVGILRWHGLDLEPLRRMSDSICAVGSTEGPEATGFVVARDIVLTFDVEDRATWVTSGPNDASTRRLRPISRPVARFPQYHVMLLRVPGLDLPPLPLASRMPSGANQKVGRVVAVIGYPQDDPRLPAELRSILGRAGFGTQRVMPALLLDQEEPEPRQPLRHDATTSNGVAGGPLIDVRSRLVIGVHVSGKWTGTKKDNEAIAIWNLLELPEFLNIVEDNGGRIVPSARN
jgi:hypothetical protein